MLSGPVRVQPETKCLGHLVAGEMCLLKQGLQLYALIDFSPRKEQDLRFRLTSLLPLVEVCCRSRGSGYHARREACGVQRREAGTGLLGGLQCSWGG